MLHAIVPVKSLALAKSRLSELLEPTERHALALAMLEDVLRALFAAVHVRHTSVVTHDAAVAHHAQRLGAQIFHDITQDLNTALTQAAQAAGAGNRLLIVHADLPLLQPTEIGLFAEALDQGVQLALAAARDGGTNALACINPQPIPFHFGNASLARHLAEARERSITAQLVRSRGLERDIDRPDDLIWLAEQSGNSRAQELVRALGIIERVACV
jgi:2-phospho-L-lactate/phosphoenolpyruvate guanylyltransferase